ncbi:alpha/beta hydrolase [Arthrobacter sp. H35-D1]|uniref:alpha/beta hydrolase n=1 Tax=Arthrobacter sp. H35-D1 TaxID=3046202 RepID=UPI0024BBB7D9|nr:alpha/beta hydrolase [Arthrobacter sp. H35-D1]MDJ0314890.1 alpha/beta hydrolase [Arthrobacter sp. H35-D1]
MTSPEREPSAASPPGDDPIASRPTVSSADVVLFRAACILSVVGMLATILASAVFARRFWLRRAATHAGIKVLRWIAVVAFSAVLAMVLWLVPSSATEPSLAAMASDAQVTVTETSDQIVLAPSGTPSSVGVFFQPGARVDARAYVSTLRPLAEDGHTVVIPKQPFGIAFLSTGAYNTARADHCPVNRWVVGGHSLGGTVAAIDAQSFATASSDAVVGLLLYASYPATDMSTLTAKVLSISGSNDRLATPEKIAESKTMLPAGTTYKVIEGGVHADFGDYGPQTGDGQPSISPDAARTEITGATLEFVNSLGPVL